MKLKTNKYTLLGLISFVTGALAVSCSQNGEPETDSLESYQVRIGAQITPLNQTRAYQEAGQVEEGMFYLTYLNSNGEDDLARVEFFKGAGYVTKNDKVLEWTDIGTNTTTSLSVFFLDNVPANNQTTDCMVEFNEQYHPFDAGKFDDDEGSNDLLWGMNQVARETPVVNFDLFHCMSRVNLQVTLETGTDAPIKSMDLENAKVKITKLQLRPEKYDRKTGNLILPDREEEGSVEDLWLLDDSNRWAFVSESSEDGVEKKIFLSHDFVLPPQDLTSDENRSRLSITIPGLNGAEDVTYSGFIPRVMEKVQEDNSIVPMTLSFLRGNVLTFHVRLSPEPLEIIFLPATVADWVDKGTFIIGVKQAELDTTNFLNFVEAFNANNESELTKYGYKDTDGVWVFNIFKDLTFKYSEISNIITVDTPFTFALHGWTVTITDDNGETLYDIKKADTLVKLMKSTNE